MASLLLSEHAFLYISLFHHELQFAEVKSQDSYRPLSRRTSSLNNKQNIVRLTKMILVILLDQIQLAISPADDRLD